MPCKYGPHVISCGHDGGFTVGRAVRKKEHVVKDESERERCARLASDWMRGGEEAYDHPEEFREAVGNLEDMLMRERAAARAPVEAEVARAKELLTLAHKREDELVERALRAEWRLAQLRAGVEERDEARGYLSRLFVSHAPQCKALPSLLGVCTQIDNAMTVIPELKANLAILKDERDQLRAKVERVEALPAKWLERDHSWRDEPDYESARAEGKAMQEDVCIRELEAALRDEGES